MAKYNYSKEKKRANASKLNDASSNSTAWNAKSKNKGKAVFVDADNFDNPMKQTHYKDVTGKMFKKSPEEWQLLDKKQLQGLE